MGLILLGLAQSALILLGIGIVSSRFKAGTGLGELGEGITSLVSAPLRGTGLGLSSVAGGIRDISETFGDLGRGLSELFGAIPKLPPAIPGNGNGQQLESLPIRRATLITNSSSDLVTGGGLRVPPPSLMQPIAPGFLPRPTIAPSPTPFQPGPAPDTNIYTRNRDLVML